MFTKEREVQKKKKQNKKTKEYKKMSKVRKKETMKVNLNKSNLHPDTVTRYARTVSGITLIALIVTIIVLLILAGVSLNLVSGSDGILGRATNAVNKNNEAKVAEEVELAMAELQMEYYQARYVDGTTSGSFADYAKAKLESTNGVATTNGTLKLSGTTVSYTPKGESTVLATGSFDSTTGGVTIAGTTTGGGTPTPPPTEYTITYNSNGGTGTMEATTGASPEVASNGFTAPTNSTGFAGWNTSADGSGSSVAVGSTVSANTTLYAQWNWTAYTVGDTVTIGGESFYVIKDSGPSENTVTLLAAMNVKTTEGEGQYTQTSGANTLAFDDSSNDYATSDIAQQVGYYKTAVEGRMGGGKTIQEARLMTKEEVVALGGDIENGTTSGCTGTTAFVNATSYWLGSPHETWNIIEWVVRCDCSGFATSDEYDQGVGDPYEFGLRPVIIVLKSDI